MSGDKSGVTWSFFFFFLILPYRKTKFNHFLPINCAKASAIASSQNRWKMAVVILETLTTAENQLGSVVILPV